MRTFTRNEPLSDTELDHLGDFLNNCKGGRAMHVEELDGFFAALIAGTEAVMPSEYYYHNVTTTSAASAQTILASAACRRDQMPHQVSRNPENPRVGNEAEIGAYAPTQLLS